MSMTSRRWRQMFPLWRNTRMSRRITSIRPSVVSPNPGVSYGRVSPRRSAALALGVLRGFAGALEAGLLPFFHSRIPGQHAVLFQYRAHGQIGDAERPGDAMLHRAGLAGHAAAIDHGTDVEPFGAFRQLEGIDEDHLQHPPAEVLQRRLVVDHDRAIAWIEADARDRVLAPSGAVVVGGVIGQ